MRKILLADDSNVAQRMGKEILSAEGFEVITVSNGQAALKKLKEFIPDLILADVFMPGRNGYELCQFAKSEGRLSHIPVVLLVGAMEPFDPEEGRKVRADGMITKPLQASNLVKVVQDLLASVKPPAPPPPPVPVVAVEEAWPGGARAKETSEEESPGEYESPEARLQVPQEMADQPVSPFEDYLQAALKSQANLEAPGETPITEVLSPPPLSPKESETGLPVPGEVGVSDAEKPLAFMEELFDSVEETEANQDASEEGLVTEDLFPSSLAPMEPETLFPARGEAEIAREERLSHQPPDQSLDLSWPAGDREEPAMNLPKGAAAGLAYEEGTLQEPPPVVVHLAETESLADLSEVKKVETVELRQPPIAETPLSETPLPAVIPSVSEGSALIAETPSSETQLPENIFWMAEPAEVTAEDENLVDQTLSDWEGLTKLVEVEDTENSRTAFPWDRGERTPAARVLPEGRTRPEPPSPPVSNQAEVAAVVLLEKEVPQEPPSSPAPASDQTAAAAAGHPEELAPQEPALVAPQQAEKTEAEPLGVNAARIEQLVRLSLEGLMPEIVEMIVRTVGKTLRREEE